MPTAADTQAAVGVRGVQLARPRRVGIPLDYRAAVIPVDHEAVDHDQRGELQSGNEVALQPGLADAGVDATRPDGRP
jgi:hypothetical protein